MPQRKFPKGTKRPVGQPQRGVSVGAELTFGKVYAEVSFLPCTFCGQRERGKLAGLYAYWYETDESRTAYKCRSCVVCLTDLLGSLKASVSNDSLYVSACPMCGTDASQNLSGVFLTIYPPKQPEREYALTTCTSCANSLRARLSMGEKLADRNSAGAAAPALNSSSAWSDVPW